MKRYLIFLLLATAVRGYAGDNPKYEFRGAWVATVNNIDWPSKPGLSAEEQQREAVAMLDMLQGNGINAVVFQGRPCSDAFYPSTLEPWSRYLTGTPGKSPGYDPLAFWIEQCHRRNMELHLWCNPYRVAQNAAEPLAANHVAFRHPDWIISYGNKLYFNPGLPETRSFIVEVICDIVRRYDVDAIHFDDYFYPYPVNGVPFPDGEAFAMYGGEFSPAQIDDWRRNNVDIAISMLSYAIKQTKPWVKFGISPFGVWRNKADDERGSSTSAGVTNYDNLYADILKWVQNGWVDYVAPQLYWQIGHPSADFTTLCHWWNDNILNRTLYIGQAPYRIEAESSTEAWRQPDQMPRQIQTMRSIGGIGGSIFYSAKHFNRDLLGFQDSLRVNLYRHPALVPTMPWIDDKPPLAPVKPRKRGKNVKWEAPKFSSELDRPVSYVVYAAKKGAPVNPDTAESVVGITRNTSLHVNKTAGKRSQWYVVVTAVDRLGNESEFSKPVSIRR
ncbi:MAG: family 10 glycosylhydrolase [Bacteroidales bacterium]|jgi:uncharacterized lipoprotein YddW (UPF0748 family)|nr:family 10 glycosylhydrolase [Bacteroidales bacterium]